MSDGAHPRILLIHRDEQLREAARLELQAAAFEVDAQSSPAGAVESLLTGGRVGGIVLGARGLSMPAGALIRLLRRQGGPALVGAPVLLLVAESGQEWALSISSPDDHLREPWNPGSLAQRLAFLCRAGRPAVGPRAVILGGLAPEPDLPVADMQRAFHAHGFRTQVVATTDSIAEVVGERPADVWVVCDSPELLGEGPPPSVLLEAARRSAVVVLAGQDDPRRAVRWLELGVDDYLPAGTAPELVVRACQSAWNKRHRQRVEGQQKMHIEAVVNAAPVILWSVDREGTVILSEGNGLASLGLQPGEWVGRSAYQLYREDPYVAEMIRRALGGEQVQVEARLGELCFDTRCGPIRGVDGQIEGAICVSTDITPRRQAEKAAAYLSRFEQLVTAISTQFINLAAGEVRDGIQHVLETLGLFAAVDRCYVFCFAPDLETCSNTHEWCGPGIESTRERLQELRVQHFPWIFERIRRHEVVHIPLVSALPEEAWPEQELFERDGVRSGICVPMACGGELLGFLGFDSVREQRTWPEGIAGLLRIVGEIFANALRRQRAEEERLFLEGQLRQAQKLEALGTLAGGVAHDFNNLLTAILGYANLMRRESGDLEVVQHSAEVIENAAGRAAGLTRQLLGFARQDEGQRVVFDVHALVREVISLLRSSLDRRLTVEDDLTQQPALVRGDADQIQHVILNLALNARDAMPQGGRLGFETRRVELGTDGEAPHLGVPAGPYLELIVWDTGVGIEPEARERLFEPFFTTKAPGTASGMGLAMAYGTLKSHGGLVRVESEVGLGTTFRVYLPLVPEETLGSASLIPRDPPQGRGVLLLVDDEQLVRDTASAMLRSLGYTVITAEDGEEALGVYSHRAEEIDLVLLDMIMPRLGGRECLHRLRTLNPEVRVLLCSGWDFGGAQDFRSEGALGYLRKPFPLGQLAQAVSQALVAQPAPMGLATAGDESGGH